MAQRQTLRSMGQNRDRQNKPMLTPSVIFDKGDKIIQWGKRVSSVNVPRQTDQLYAKE